MKFSTTCELSDREGQFFVVRTGPRNSRVLACGEPRERSFKLPNEKVINRRKVDPIAATPETPLEPIVEPDDSEFVPQ